MSVLGGGLNRSRQHFILERKDGVWRWIRDFVEITELFELHHSFVLCDLLNESNFSILRDLAAELRSTPSIDCPTVSRLLSAERRRVLGVPRPSRGESECRGLGGRSACSALSNGFREGILIRSREPGQSRKGFISARRAAFCRTNGKTQRGLRDTLRAHGSCSIHWVAPLNLIHMEWR
jgi:hypothetical protein